MSKKFFVVIEKGKNGYIGSVAGLYGCRSRAKNVDKLMKGMKSIIKNYLKTDEFYPYKIDFEGVRILKTNRHKHTTFIAAIEKSGKYYVGCVPSIEGCFTQGRNMEELIKNIKEVIGICFDLKKPYEKTEFVGVGTVEVYL